MTAKHVRSREQCKTCENHHPVDRNFFRCLERNEEYSYMIGSPCSAYQVCTRVKSTPKFEEQVEDLPLQRRECVTCSAYRDVSTDKFYCDRRGEQIAKKYIVCHMHTTKGRKKMPKPKPELKPQKHFHRWTKKTGVYVGTSTTTTGAPPVDNLVHEYEEFEPPTRKDPDGWYIVRHNAEGALKQLIQKEGNKILDLSGKVLSEYWSDYTIVARIPHVEWVNEEDNSC